MSKNDPHGFVNVSKGEEGWGDCENDRGECGESNIGALNIISGETGIKEGLRGRVMKRPLKRDGSKKRGVRGKEQQGSPEESSHLVVGTLYHIDSADTASQDPNHLPTDCP